MWQGLRMAVSRKPNGLVDVARGCDGDGLVGGGDHRGVHGAAGVGWVRHLGARPGAQGQSPSALLLASLTGVSAPGAVLVLGFVMIVVGLFQAVLMFLREGALIRFTG